MTLDQIEERDRLIAAGAWDLNPGPSLQQAARGVGLPFAQCGKCRGVGYLRATLLASPRAMRVLAEAIPTEPLPIARERCLDCDGAGGRIAQT